MIALGGTIGTGLFLASGQALASSGPGGSLVSYLIISIMVYFVMTSLGILFIIIFIYSIKLFV
jgi:lysine-specific permease